jgi:hypothetical protein
MAVTPEKRIWKCRPEAQAFGRFDQSLKKNTRVYLLYQAQFICGKIFHEACV